MRKLLLTLYISGRTQKSLRAIESLKGICEKDLGGKCELKVVDVLEHPETVEREQILVTPMLVKESPQPVRRVVGDLTDRKKVLTGLGIEQ